MVLVVLDFGISSSSDGVGNTLKGVLVELFLGVFEAGLAGVGAAETIDLFLGDEREGSSYVKLMAKTFRDGYLGKIYLRPHFSILVRFNFNDSLTTWTNTAFLL